MRFRLPAGSANFPSGCRHCFFSRWWMVAWLLLWPGVGWSDPPPSSLRVVIIGDSTVCDYPPGSARRGWGEFVQGYFTPAILVKNSAVSGASTKTFLALPRWHKALAAKPDVVLIQFGHNDSLAPPDPRATDAATEYRTNLGQFIDSAREAGAEPILVTPMHYIRVGKHGDVTDNLQPYAAAMAAVATEKKVKLIDLYAESGRLFASLVEKGVEEFRSEPGETVHFSEAGAKALASLVVEKLVALEPRLQAERRMAPAPPVKPEAASAAK